MEIEGAVEALTIIEGFDVIEDGGPGVGMGGEIAAIDEFELEGAPEAFHGGIVIAVALATHGLEEIGLGQSRAEIAGGVLGPPVGVEEQLGSGLTVLQRHGESLENEGGVDPFAHGPADDLAAVEIQDTGEVEPTFPSLDIGDIGDPDLIGRGGCWRLRHAIGGDRVGMIAVGGLDAVATLLATADACLAHEAGNPLASMSAALVA